MAQATRDPLLAARVPKATKVAFRALAERQGLNESALLVALVGAVLERNGEYTNTGEPARAPASERLSLRLRRDDRTLLEQHAKARGMKPASYALAILRAHIRRDALLPPPTLDGLKAAVARLGSMERALLQAQQEQPSPLLRECMEAMDDLRREVSEVVRSHLIAWEADDGDQGNVHRRAACRPVLPTRAGQPRPQGP